MWLFTRHGFYSVVCGKQRERDTHGVLKKSNEVDMTTMLVRSRDRAHLENLLMFVPKLLKGVSITETPHTDYRYRLVVSRHVWNQVAQYLQQDVRYGNFKGKCHEEEEQCGEQYVTALHEVWSTMHRTQVRPEVQDKRSLPFD